MTNKEEKILELLREGKSYTSIQNILQVSPSKIAQIKKEYFTTEELEYSTTDTTTFTTEEFENSTTDTTTFTTDSGSDVDSSSNIGSEIENNTIINPKKTINMTNDDIYNEDELDYSERASLEKLKIKCAHEINLKRIERENKELELRSRELSLKEKNANIETNKMDKQAKALIFRFRKLVDGLVDEEWTIGELKELLEKATELKEKVESYCFENDIETEGLRIIFILERIEKEIEEFIEDDEDDEEPFDITFENLYEEIEEAKEIVFYSYK